MATAVTGCMDERTEHERELVRLLSTSKLFPGVDEAELACLIAAGREQSHAAGLTIATETEPLHEFMILIGGHVRISRRGTSDKEIFHKVVSAPAFLGETGLLANMGGMTVIATDAINGLHVNEENFWRVMSTCPALRHAIIDQMTMRILGAQQMAAQQEKLMALGTMTAGLMHELNNPGAAAQRAASQLRDNLKRMHQLARSFSERGHTEQQRSCLGRLQERVLSTDGSVCMDSLQQSDAEEEMGAWMDRRSVPDAWTVAPTLVASGLGIADLECLQDSFPGAAIHEPLQWLEATASSMQQVGLVEDSVSRVHHLAKAVKMYAHEGQGGQQTVSVNESLHATLVILKHKLREKNLHLEKKFGADLPPLTCMCTGLNQIWTNLLDNAIDAAPPDGHIGVRTWKKDGDLYVSITDDGPGIPPENQERIFDPFFTTKPAGIGTGMGLGIVKRMLELYHGQLDLHSVPGDTEFTVRIPLESSARDAMAA